MWSRGWLPKISMPHEGGGEQQYPGSAASPCPPASACAPPTQTADVTSMAPPPPASEAEDPTPHPAQALRDSWKFPAIVRFCRVFEVPLKLRQFSSDRLERALVCPAEHPAFLAELVYKLMTVDRRQPFCLDTANEKWEAMLTDKLRRFSALMTHPNPLQTQGFTDLAPAARVCTAHPFQHRPPPFCRPPPPLLVCAQPVGAPRLPGVILWSVLTAPLTDGDLTAELTVVFLSTQLDVLYFLTEKITRDSGTIKDAIKNAVGFCSCARCCENPGISRTFPREFERCGFLGCRWTTRR